jgi:hypothetical protein
LQHGDAETLAIGSHLCDVRPDKGSLNLQINLSGALKVNSPVSRPVFFRNTGLGKRCVLNLYVNLATDRAHAGRAIDFTDELRGVCLGKGPEQRLGFHFALDAEQTGAAAHKEQAERE